MNDDNYLIVADVLKLYPNGTVKATKSKYNHSRTTLSEWEQSLKQEEHERMMSFEWYRDMVAKKEESKQYRSMRRAKQTIADYTLCNDFVWFGSLTFKEQIYDRDVAKKKVQKWFDNLKQRKYKDLKYIAIFEMHEKGGWHVHALLSDECSADMEYAQKRCIKGSKKRRSVYHMKSWRFGFTDLERIDDKERVSSYICKYITKDMFYEKSAQMYLVSKNCEKPVELRSVAIDQREYDLPFENEHCIIWSAYPSDKAKKYFNKK